MNSRTRKKWQKNWTCSHLGWSSHEVADLAFITYCKLSKKEGKNGYSCADCRHFTVSQKCMKQVYTMRKYWQRNIEARRQAMHYDREAWLKHK